MIQKIESVQNETVKRACKLAVSAKFRQAEQAFFLEGARLCCDAAMSGAAVLQCFVTEDALRKESDRLSVLLESAKQTALISDAVAHKLSQTMSPQGVFCVCAMDQRQPAIDESGVYLALDHIRDPANLGAMIRTAEALGLNGAILCGCCDVYNPKAQRAAMGSLLRLPQRRAYARTGDNAGRFGAKADAAAAFRRRDRRDRKRSQRRLAGCFRGL